jgi:hypothetical protein
VRFGDGSRRLRAELRHLDDAIAQHAAPGATRPRRCSLRSSGSAGVNIFK